MDNSGLSERFGSAGAADSAAEGAWAVGQWRVMAPVKLDLAEEKQLQEQRDS